MGEIFKECVRQYRNLEEALGSLIKEDKDFIIIQHALKLGDRIELHWHNLANEWVLISEGKVEIEISGQRLELEGMGGTAAVLFPRGKEHSLVARSDISYFVLRDKKDRTVYSRR